jgi:hypothetical protein
VSDQYPARQYEPRSDRRAATSKISELLDRLDGLIADGVRFPMTSKVMIEEEEVIEIVDSLREAIAELQRQTRSMAPAPSVEPVGMPQPPQRLPSTALNPASRPDGLADNEIIQVAQQRADAMLNDAQQRAVEIVAGADAYALEVLGKVETELNRLVATVRRGRATLETPGPPVPQETELAPMEHQPPPSVRPRMPITPQYLTGRDEARRRNNQRDRG